MKKWIGMLVIFSLLFTSLAFAATAEEPTKGFVIDGVLDKWYLEESPQGDLNQYYYPELDPFLKPGGTAYYDDAITSASVWTAYDDTYIYFYVKVWDNNIVPWNEADGNSSHGDSIEFWVDPDPASQAEYDPQNPQFHKQTRDERQGDIQCRLVAERLPTGNEEIDNLPDNRGRIFFVNDYHNKIKPGYNGQTFSDYIYDKANFCPFHFENEDNGHGVTSGYGVEARFPRNDDKTKSYRFNIVANNAPEENTEWYSLAIGGAWWMTYNTTVTISFSDTNPFFAQEFEDDSSSDPSVPSEPTLKRGDIDGDGLVNAADALLVLRSSVGKYQLTEVQTKNADLNDDKKINAADALIILQIAVGKRT